MRQVLLVAAALLATVISVVCLEDFTFYALTLQWPPSTCAIPCLRNSSALRTYQKGLLSMVYGHNVKIPARCIKAMPSATKSIIRQNNLMVQGKEPVDIEDCPKLSDTKYPCDKNKVQLPPAPAHAPTLRMALDKEHSEF
ncbi:hypothetical protein V6N11_070155 [Hibiscus sabdariffa]|uniref:Uncharacterized protein n=1 Tax=Hibiscus sabdariffa TaxID=183260 RepID=A0ABR2QE64_9ROSI